MMLLKIPHWPYKRCAALVGRSRQHDVLGGILIGGFSSGLGLILEARYWGEGNYQILMGLVCKKAERRRRTKGLLISLTC